MSKNHPLRGKADDALYQRLQAYLNSPSCVESESDVVRKGVSIYLNPEFRALISMKEAGLIVVTVSELRSMVKKRCMKMARCFKCGVFYKDKEKHKRECEVYKKECSETVNDFARFLKGRLT